MTNETKQISEEEFFAKGGYEKDVARASPEFRETYRRIRNLQALVEDSDKNNVWNREMAKLRGTLSFDKYYGAISVCQSRVELDDRYGVGDNYIVLLNADFDKVTNDLKSDPRYELFGEYDGNGIPDWLGLEYLSPEKQKKLLSGSEDIFKYCALRLSDGGYIFIRKPLVRNSPYEFSEIENVKESDKRARETYGNYSMSIQLHQSPSHSRDTLLEIIKYIKKNNLSCCLIGRRDYCIPSPIYYPDKLKGSGE